jgi:hypothetical protein
MYLHLEIITELNAVQKRIQSLKNMLIGSNGNTQLAPSHPQHLQQN